MSAPKKLWLRKGVLNPDSPLSSKVAMFNNQAQQHKNSQLMNPFSSADGRASPKPTFSKDEYGKPLAGSLTEQRGQKANIHVINEMKELCHVIHTEGYIVKDEPTMRVIPFGELFNIYNYISDKVVGILLRARKHKLVQFEGEMLFQRRDDDVPVFLLKPIKEVNEELNTKVEDIKRAASPSPAQATSILMDKAAQQQKRKNGAAAGLAVPGSGQSGNNSERNSKSRTPSPAAKAQVVQLVTTPAPQIIVENEKTEIILTENAADVVVNNVSNTQIEKAAAAAAAEPIQAVNSEETVATIQNDIVAIIENEITKTVENSLGLEKTAELISESDNNNKSAEEVKVAAADLNNNNGEKLDNINTEELAAIVIENAPVNKSVDDLPTIVIEASAVYVRPENSNSSEEKAEGSATN